MNRKQLLVLGGVFVIVAFLVQREVQRDYADVQIHDHVPDPEPDDDPASAEDLQTLKGIGPAYAKRLIEAGVNDLADLVDSDPRELADGSDIDETRIRAWIRRANDRTDA